MITACDVLLPNFFIRFDRRVGTAFFCSSRFGLLSVILQSSERRSWGYKYTTAPHSLRSRKTSCDKTVEEEL